MPDTPATRFYAVATDYDRNQGRKRDHVTVWSGPFASVPEADGVSLPKGDGYMLTTYGGDKVRVSCPTPRTDENFQQVDDAIGDALRAHYAAQATAAAAPAEPDGTVVLCDDCFEEVAGDLAQCQDGCSQSLDHDGTCDPREHVGDRCTRCGKVDRLTSYDVENLDEEDAADLFARVKATAEAEQRRETEQAADLAAAVALDGIPRTWTVTYTETIQRRTVVVLPVVLPDFADADEQAAYLLDQIGEPGQTIASAVRLDVAEPVRDVCEHGRPMAEPCGPCAVAGHEPVDVVEDAGPFTWSVRYVVRSGNGSGIVGEGEAIVTAADEAAAGSAAVAWAHEHDPRCDERVDPFVTVEQIDEVERPETCERCRATFDADQAGTTDSDQGVSLCADCTANNAARVVV